MGAAILYHVSVPSRENSVVSRCERDDARFGGSTREMARKCEDDDRHFYFRNTRQESSFNKLGLSDTGHHTA